MTKSLCLVAILALGLLGSGCSTLSRSELVDYRARYTCCNIRYEHRAVNDANYGVGSLLPLGTPMQVLDTGAHWAKVAFPGDPGNQLVLTQEYGRHEESFRTYLDKLLVRDDPRLRLATFPADVQRAITAGRVERGMTKEQVLMAVGYPPTHRTPSTASPEWIYWSSRFRTYRVAFAADDTVAWVGPADVPTTYQATTAAVPPDNPLAKVQVGMGMKQVTDLIGPPTDSKSSLTGKVFIPFYLGEDRAQMIAYYKGLGRVIYSIGSGTPQVSRVEYDPTESGYLR